MVNGEYISKYFRTSYLTASYCIATAGVCRDVRGLLTQRISLDHPDAILHVRNCRQIQWRDRHLKQVERVGYDRVCYDRVGYKRGCVMRGCVRRGCVMRRCVT